MILLTENNTNTLDYALLVIMIICMVGLLVSISLMIYFYFKKKNKSKTKKMIGNDEITKKLNMPNTDIQKTLINYFDQIISNDTIDKINEIEKTSNDLIQEKINKILINAMENINLEIFNKTSSEIEVPKSLVGRFIGKDGMNIKTIEKICSCQVSIKNDNIIKINSFNPYKKELAYRLIKKLIKLESFDRNRIEKKFEITKKEFHDELTKIGQDVLKKLNITNIDKGIYPYIGRLKYRTSYNQNVLSHSIECANIAEQIAVALNLDVDVLKQAAFFHDIGKSIDYEDDFNHVKSGINLAKKYHLNKYVCDAIESHHDEKIEEYDTSKIVKVIDKLSASRPGARLENSDDTNSKIEEIEKICNSIKNIKNHYIVRNGKEIIINVDQSIDDKAFKSIGMKIKQKIRENTSINYMDIKVTVIKEQKYSL